MGRPKKQDNDGLPPEPKPRKLFKMEFIIWDDGEITSDLSEVRYGDRGAPKSWRVEPSDFMRSASSSVGDSKHIMSSIFKALDISEEQLRVNFARKDEALNKASAVGNAIANSIAKSPPKNEDERDDKSEEDLNFDFE